MSDQTSTPSSSDTDGSRAERPMSHDKPTQSLRPTALTLAEVARLLTQVGGQPVRVDAIQADLAAGAPVNADGTINPVHYAAWLAREMTSHD